METTKARKGFGALLAIVMALTLTLLGGVTSAYADDPVDGVPVCKIGDTTYNSIAEAVAAAPENTPTTITVIGDATVETQIDIPANKTITLRDDGTQRTIHATAGMFNVLGDLTIAGTNNDNLHLYGGTAQYQIGTIASVSGTGHLTLTAGTLHGGSIDVATGAVYILDGMFDMTGGIITDCDGDVTYNAPVYISGSGTMNLSGGSIQDNISPACAGVLLLDIDRTKIPTLNMTGGKITNNTGGEGTAVFAMVNSRVNISGGEISENHGALYSASIISLKTISELTMTGGKIINNTSVYAGAVKTDSTGQCTFTAGEISGNTADVIGGGIFGTVSGTKIHVENCLVTENTATVMGGGLWCCPTGGADINASRGVAIFDNTADGAGDDYASLYLEEDKDKKGNIHLSNYTLGDNRVDYFLDGGVEAKSDGDNEYERYKVSPDVPRYDANNPGNPITVDGPATENQAMKAVVSDDNKTAAKDQAKMIITNNTAGYGGGIATNGIVTAGYTDQDLDQKHQITVSKQDGIQINVTGATLTVTDEFGIVVDEWPTEANADHTCSLIPGTYTVTETITPANYKTADPITFSVDRNGNITIDGTAVDQVTMIDEFLDREVLINKIGSDSNAVKGAELQVAGTDICGNQVNLNWKSDGAPHTLTLQPGTYTFHEVSAPKGYEVAQDFEFTITADGTIQLTNANGNETTLDGNTITVIDKGITPEEPTPNTPEDSGESDTPKTGDTANLALIAALTLSSLLAASVSWQRVRSTRTVRGNHAR